MTIICALRVPGEGVWVGSDTFVSEGDLRFPCGPKWDFRNGWAVGAAGPLRLANLIQAHLPDLFSGGSPAFPSLVNAWHFAQRLRSILREDHWEPRAKSDGRPPGYKLAVLLTDGADVWTVGEDLDVLPIFDFAAEGCGREFAYGAYYGYREFVARAGFEQRAISGPSYMMKTAVMAAIRYNAGCGGEPFVRKV